MINSISAISLEVRFWPDRNDTTGQAWLLVKEDKVDSSKENK